MSWKNVTHSWLYKLVYSVDVHSILLVTSCVDNAVKRSKENHLNGALGNETNFKPVNTGAASFPRVPGLGWFWGLSLEDKVHLEPASSQKFGRKWTSHSYWLRLPKKNSWWANRAQFDKVFVLFTIFNFSVNLMEIWLNWMKMNRVGRKNCNELALKVKKCKITACCFKWQTHSYSELSSAPFV